MALAQHAEAFQEVLRAEYCKSGWQSHRLISPAIQTVPYNVLPGQSPMKMKGQFEAIVAKLDELMALCDKLNPGYLQSASCSKSWRNDGGASRRVIGEGGKPAADRATKQASISTFVWQSAAWATPAMPGYNSKKNGEYSRFYAAFLPYSLALEKYSCLYLPGVKRLFLSIPLSLRCRRPPFFVPFLLFVDHALLNSEGGDISNCSGPSLFASLTIPPI